MPNILLLSGSARENSAGTILFERIEQLATAKGLTIDAVDIRTLELPFFNESTPPSSPDFSPKSQAGANWAKRVASADGFIFLTPEYNAGLTAIQKNAIDWVSAGWVGKPVALVGYGWTGAKRAQAQALITLNNVKAHVLPTATSLLFMRELNPDGSIADEATVTRQLGATLNELVTMLS